MDRRLTARVFSAPRYGFVSFVSLVSLVSLALALAATPTRAVAEPMARGGDAGRDEKPSDHVVIHEQPTRPTGRILVGASCAQGCGGFEPAVDAEERARATCAIVASSCAVGDSEECVASLLFERSTIDSFTSNVDAAIPGSMGVAAGTSRVPVDGSPMGQLLVTLAIALILAVRRLRPARSGAGARASSFPAACRRAS